MDFKRKDVLEKETKQFTVTSLFLNDKVKVGDKDVDLMDVLGKGLERIPLISFNKKPSTSKTARLTPVYKKEYEKDCENLPPGVIVMRTEQTHGV